MSGRQDQLKKDLGLFDVYAISTGAMFSSGFFLLPGLAAALTGTSVPFAYLLAGLLILPAMFSVAELATAMPRAGGAYFFIMRSLGTMMGVIGGLGTYFALVLKTAFALLGMGAYLALFIDVDIKMVAVVLTVAFGVLNLVGAKETTGLQRFLVSILVLVLVVFCLEGLIVLATTPAWSEFVGADRPFLSAGIAGLFSTVGFVFVSYAGLTKVASVAEEVKNPERNLPLGMILSLVSTSIIYVIGVGILTILIPEDVFSTDLTPVATATENMFPWLPGRIALLGVTIAALAAFASTGNAGIMSASRYPFAMARDQLVPEQFKKLGRLQTPTLSIVCTAALIVILILALNETGIAKLASAFQLFIFLLLNVAVIVLRESHISSYEPGYRSPLYPWMQLFGIVAMIGLLAYMGWSIIAMTTGAVLLCLVWYWAYVRKRVSRDSALLSLLLRIGDRKDRRTERELRVHMDTQSDEISLLIRECVENSQVLDIDHQMTDYDDLVAQVSGLLATRTNVTSDELIEGFDQARTIGAIPVWHGVAIPHLNLFGITRPHMVLVRMQKGIHLDAVDVHGDQAPDDLVQALLFLVSPEENPKVHLRMLARIAESVDKDDFLERWASASGPEELRMTLTAPIQ